MKVHRPSHSALLRIFFWIVYLTQFNVRAPKGTKHLQNEFFANLGLSSIEKQILTNLLRDDAGMADRNPTSSTRLSWQQVLYVFIDWQIYLYALISIGNFSTFICLTTVLPTLVEDMGFSTTEVPLMTSPVYVVACISCLLISYSSSRRNDHSYHIVFCFLVGLCGFILMITLFDHGKIPVYISITVTFCGVLSAYPLLLSWLTNNVGGHTKRSVAISVVFGIDQIGGVIIPLVRVLPRIDCRKT